MRSPSSSLNASTERARLAEVRTYNFLRAEKDDTFDEIVGIAARIFNTPTSLVSLVEEDVQWFAAQKGFDPCQTSRDVSFCAHALESTNVLVVPDAKSDPRFCDNGLVTGEPFIRFYAGAPLITSNGNILGTLCIIDIVPRAVFSDEDKRILASLAKLAVDQLELKRLSQMQRAALCLNRTSQDAIIHFDLEGTVNYANLSAHRIFEYADGDLVNGSINCLISPAFHRKLRAALRKFAVSETDQLSLPPYEGTGRTRTGKQISIEVSAGAWKSAENMSVGLIVRDITERKMRQASFEMLFDRNPIAMWIFDAKTLNFVAINDAACALYGYSRAEALTKTALDVRPEAERAAIRSTICSFGESYESSSPGTHITASGTALKILTFARRLRHNGKDCVVVANIDVTERDKAESELASTQIFLNAVIESIPSMIFVKEASSGKFVLLNKAGEKLLGTTRDKFVGKTDFDLFDSADAERFSDADRTAIHAGKKITTINETISTPAGLRLLRTQKVGVPDADGEARYLLGISEDITEAAEAEKRTQYLAHHDILTDLPNRRSFQIEMQNHISKPQPFAVLLFDLDRFKVVNDTIGHHGGDELLRQLAARLMSIAGKADVLARLGGDEFALIHRMQTGTDQSALKLGERIVAALSQPFTIDGRKVSIGCSVGIATYPKDGASTDLLLKRADLALYAAKSSGQGGVRLFHIVLEERANRNRMLRDELRSAFVTGQLDLNFQPIYDAVTRKVVCCEALLRWTHPQYGPISPSEFIPAAENSGLINDIGNWVLERACMEAAKWPSSITVAVNLSPKQFSGFGLPASVARALSKSGLAPDRLELEITESVFLADTDENIALLRDLKNLGVRIALDDFGTGYSSLAYLRQFSFDKLKIDRAFVSEVAHCKDSLAIVRAVIGLGRSFSAVVTAEGVENAEQCAQLQAEGCDQFQGYFFSKPIGLESLQALFSEEDHSAASSPIYEERSAQR
ncbi:EAL domain-containing protein [Agrobacterium sp. SORGH_AS 787]|uniref:bifunctional diguanylate cyclase/phosphodiesterase n=1 Tax=Agrobacterium sp. SORGH_AS 787 TaxID=3041775 RepID=UPI0027827C61|nr:diguanylate cyclase (GGDEF)-like protein/PAS domain S-box-containing protein [Rhizobium sp. SORGH_AS_0787]